MGNQSSGLAARYGQPESLVDLPSVVYKDTLGGSRLMKSYLCVHESGSLVVVKVFPKEDADAPLRFYEHRIRDVRARLALSMSREPRAALVASMAQSESAVFLVRQYLHSSLAQRVSRRPFLLPIEKVWIAHQILVALSLFERAGVVHGDLKPANVLLTSWGWVVLADVAAYKPATLPADNPAPFSLFYDTMPRRTCCIAPERFVGGTAPPAAGGGGVPPTSGVERADGRAGAPPLPGRGGPGQTPGASASAAPAPTSADASLSAAKGGAPGVAGTGRPRNAAGRPAGESGSPSELGSRTAPGSGRVCASTSSSAPNASGAAGARDAAELPDAGATPSVSQVPVSASAPAPPTGATHAADVFSAGATIAQLFLDGDPLFDYSELLAYRAGTFSPHERLSRLPPAIRELVTHMVQTDPSKRLSARQYLSSSLGRAAFPAWMRAGELRQLLARAAGAKPDELAELLLASWGKVTAFLAADLERDSARAPGEDAGGGGGGDGGRNDEDARNRRGADEDAGNGRGAGVEQTVAKDEGVLSCPGVRATAADVSGPIEGASCPTSLPPAPLRAPLGDPLAPDGRLLSDARALANRLEAGLGLEEPKPARAGGERRGGVNGEGRVESGFGEDDGKAVNVAGGPDASGKTPRGTAFAAAPPCSASAPSDSAFGSPPAPSSVVPLLSAPRQRPLSSRSISAVAGSRDAALSHPAYVILLALLCTASTGASATDAKIELLYALRDAAARCGDDAARLGRAVPWLVASADERSAAVTCAALGALCDVLASVAAPPEREARLYSEYVFPSLSKLPHNPHPGIAAAYGTALPKLARTAGEFLATLRQGRRRGGAGAGAGAAPRGQLQSLQGNLGASALAGDFQGSATATRKLSASESAGHAADGDGTSDEKGVGVRKKNGISGPAAAVDAAGDGEEECTEKEAGGKLSSDVCGDDGASGQGVAVRGASTSTDATKRAPSSSCASRAAVDASLSSPPPTSSHPSPSSSIQTLDASDASDAQGRAAVGAVGAGAAARSCPACDSFSKRVPEARAADAAAAGPVVARPEPSSSGGLIADQAPPAATAGACSARASTAATVSDPASSAPTSSLPLRLASAPPSPVGAKAVSSPVASSPASPLSRPSRRAGGASGSTPPTSPGAFSPRSASAQALGVDLDEELSSVRSFVAREAAELLRSRSPAAALALAPRLGEVAAFLGRAETARTLAPVVLWAVRAFEEAAEAADESAAAAAAAAATAAAVAAAAAAASVGAGAPTSGAQRGLWAGAAREGGGGGMGVAPPPPSSSAAVAAASPADSRGLLDPYTSYATAAASRAAAGRALLRALPATLAPLGAAAFEALAAAALAARAADGSDAAARSAALDAARDAALRGLLRPQALRRVALAAVAGGALSSRPAAERAAAVELVAAACRELGAADALVFMLPALQDAGALRKDPVDPADAASLAAALAAVDRAVLGGPSAATAAARRRGGGPGTSGTSGASPETTESDGASSLRRSAALPPPITPLPPPRADVRGAPLRVLPLSPDAVREDEGLLGAALRAVGLEAYVDALLPRDSPAAALGARSLYLTRSAGPTLSARSRRRRVGTLDGKTSAGRRAERALQDALASDGTLGQGADADEGRRTDAAAASWAWGGGPAEKIVSATTTTATTTAAMATANAGGTALPGVNAIAQSASAGQSRASGGGDGAGAGAGPNVGATAPPRAAPSSVASSPSAALPPLSPPALRPTSRETSVLSALSASSIAVGLVPPPTALSASPSGASAPSALPPPPPRASWRPRGVLLAHYEEHARAVTHLAAGGDGSFFVSGGSDGSVRVWDARRLARDAAFRSRLTHTGHGGARVGGVACLPGGGVVVSGDSRGRVQVWRVQGGGARGGAAGRNGAGGANGANGSQAGASGSLSASAEASFSLQGAVTAIAARGPRVAVIADSRGSVSAFDLRAPPGVPAWSLRLDPAEGAPRALALGTPWAPGGEHWLATASTRGAMVLWDVRFGLPVARGRTPGSAAAVALAPAAAEPLALGIDPVDPAASRGAPLLYVATAGSREVGLWAPAEGRFVQTLRSSAWWTSTAPAASAGPGSAATAQGGIAGPGSARSNPSSVYGGSLSGDPNATLGALRGTPGTGAYGSSRNPTTSTSSAPPFPASYASSPPSSAPSVPQTFQVPETLRQPQPPRRFGATLAREALQSPLPTADEIGKRAADALADPAAVRVLLPTPSGALLTAGVDRTIRSWDAREPERSYVVCCPPPPAQAAPTDEPLAVGAEPPQPVPRFSYVRRSFQGAAVVDEVCEVRALGATEPAERAAAAAWAEHAAQACHAQTVLAAIHVRAGRGADEADLLVTASADGVVKVWK